MPLERQPLVILHELHLFLGPFLEYPLSNGPLPFMEHLPFMGIPLFKVLPHVCDVPQVINEAIRNQYNGQLTLKHELIPISELFFLIQLL